jgi:hypothetical protein
MYRKFAVFPDHKVTDANVLLSPDEWLFHNGLQRIWMEGELTNSHGISEFAWRDYGKQRKHKIMIVGVELRFEPSTSRKIV